MQWQGKVGRKVISSTQRELQNKAPNEKHESFKRQSEGIEGDFGAHTCTYHRLQRIFNQSANEKHVVSGCVSQRDHRIMSRTNEKETARTNKFPPIICSTNPQRRRRRRRRNATQHKTKQERQFPMDPSRFMYQNAFPSHHANNNSNQNFVKLQRTHTYNPISSFLFIDALSFRGTFSGRSRDASCTRCTRRRS
jgi:hypothetical protein